MITTVVTINGNCCDDVYYDGDNITCNAYKLGQYRSRIWFAISGYK